ncbi:MAG: hypothetical protein JWN70_3418 [Planctomycetaceae bacterium]|nr:hypothetical protein [Planctomycetaceae bacterium]
MNSTMVPVCLLIVSLLSWSAPVFSQDVPSGDTSLDKLKAFDSVFASGFTVSGTIQAPEIMSLVTFESIQATRNWKLTLAGERVGYVMTVTKHEAPRYRPDDADAEGNMRFIIRNKEWGYWGSDLSGRHYEDRVFMLSAGGKMTEIGTMYNSSLFGPKEMNLLRKVVLLSLGRFFSEHIDKIKQEEKGPDQRISIDALGSKDEGLSGRWRLELDPAAAWMVRRAEFYSDAFPDRKLAEMRNSGTTWFGSRCIPTAAEINYLGALDGEESRRLPFGPHRLTFSKLAETFDDELYELCRKTVSANRNESLTVHDNRVDPITITEPNRPSPVEVPKAEIPPERIPGRSFLWLYINLTTILALVMIIVVRRRMHKKEDL